MTEARLTHPVIAVPISRMKPAALAGILSAVAFFLGTAVLNVPTKASDAELVRWWSETSHQTEALLSMIAFTIAGLSFVVFLSFLRTRLLDAEGGSGTLTMIVFGAGLIFVASLFVAATARGVIAAATKSPAGEQPLPGVDLLRYLPQISYIALGFCGLLAAALAIAVTSLLAFRTGVFGRVHSWIGVVCAAGLVAANVVLIGVGAIPAMVLWTVATSIALWRGGTPRHS